MKPDPAAKMLFIMAHKDYATMRKMAADTEFADEVFGFHAQQATEKAAKAILAARGILFERTHNLEPLFDALEENGDIGVGDFAELINLTDFAVQYRYQAFDEIDAGLDRDAIANEVERFLDNARKIVHGSAVDGQ